MEANYSSNLSVNHEQIAHCKNSKIEDGFIGKDGQHHEYVLGDDYCWHTGMTNEEFYTFNDKAQLEGCQKCAIWEHCKNHEHTIFTQQNLESKMVDDLSKEINRRILADLNF